MKKALIFTTDLYQGGVAESTRKLVKLLQDDLEIIICTYDKLPINKEINNKNQLIELNLPLSAGFHKNPLMRKVVQFLRVLAFPIAVVKFLLIIKKNRPDVVYSMTYIPNLVNILTSKIFTYRCIVSERQDPREDLRTDSLISILVKCLYPLSDFVHVNSLEMVSAVKEFYSIPKEKIYRFDNFFFYDELILMSKESVTDQCFQRPANCKFYRIITSGRLSKQKGQWHLIPIVNELLKKNMPIKLYILGEGELRSELEALIKTYNLENNVFLLGNVDNPHKYVVKSDLFIFPSLWESFGNTLVEAMGLGIPVASSECRSGPKQILGDGKYGLSLGLLPKYGNELSKLDVDSISNSIMKLLTENRSRASAKSIEGFQRFDAKNFKSKILILFTGTNRE